jgi:ATP-binding cassette, subfamily B, bacterial
MPTLTHYRQHDAMDCGPTCLRMVAKYYGKHYAIDRLRIQAEYSKDSVSLLGIAQAAEGIGFKTIGAQLSLQELLQDATLPAILHWGQNHFVVLHKVKKGFKQKLILADPAKNEVVEITKAQLESEWAAPSNYPSDSRDMPSERGGQSHRREGIALLLEPTPLFYQQEEDTNSKVGWGLLLNQLHGQRKYIVQLILGLLVGSVLQLIFPYLTQSVVDTGINTQNIQFVYIVLLAQFMLMFSRSVVEFIRSRILLHISTKINIQLLSGFWQKLMRLPLHYFDTKSTGDILQRLGDQHRIESFLTGSTLSTFFSLFSFVIFAVALLQYNTMVFGIFALGSILYYLWIRIFLKQRRNLDYKRFAIASKENTATMQLIQGMQEIKLNNAEQLKRWEWEGLQANLFKLQFKSLSLSQWQQAGAFFINEGKNILITFFVAKAVIEGSLTLGQMLAIQYIIGQLNSPIEQMIGFVQQLQDAKLSLERLNEIHELPDEAAPSSSAEGGELTKRIGYEGSKSITFSNLTFKYPGAGNEPVLQNINLHIPSGKVTAIVGTSGSGKTTILKLLQKFYDNYTGEIRIGESNIHNYSPNFWRSVSSSVMQEGFIFNDNIANNITVGDDRPNYERLMQACKIANVQQFVEQLPLGFNTKIGAEGNGISTGQKQRILIARAVYKNPSFLFLDEATNALDANNEKVIMENMQQFFKGRTVVVVAHRLSTVKNADKIVVLENGLIVEEGNHEELAVKKGKYYTLIKNQLELGN